jgi:hypothetical protein
MSRLPDEASFLADVADHAMVVLSHDGIYRHLRCRRGNSWAYGFDVTTWPGFLCISGDMGCYVFSRIPDMFEFFRGPEDGEKSLYINPGYWGEKVQAADRHDGLSVYSPEKFKARIHEWLADVEASDELREAVNAEVLSRADDGEHEAMRAALEFEHGGFRFEGFYEVSLREISCRFLWCCYAVAWAVKQWDAVAKGSAVSA